MWRGFVFRVARPAERIMVAAAGGGHEIDSAWAGLFSGFPIFLQGFHRQMRFAFLAKNFPASLQWKPRQSSSFAEVVIAGR